MSIAPPRAILAPGYRLDRYELVCPIAEGGMGVCWLARVRGKHGFEKLVALKTMKQEYAGDPDFERMFLDEARIASGIDHANVAHILDLGEEDGVLFLVMEYIDGDSLMRLRRELAEKKEMLPPGIAMRVCADVLGGLQVAHDLTDASGVALGVVHRDVSPQNILISTKGVAKLIDFGVAKARDRSAGDTAAGTIKGKLHFMAPEQAVGGTLDHRADIFSVGAILYWCLAGKYAYHADTQAGTVLKLAAGKPPTPLPKSVPDRIAAIVMKSLEFDPAKRFASAAEMQAALEKAMVEHGLTTSVAQVAAFSEEWLGERARNRRKLVDQAIEAIAAGASSQTALQRADSDRAVPLTSVAGLHTNSGASMTVGASQMTPMPLPKRSALPLVVLVGGPLLALAGIGLGVVALKRNEAGAAQTIDVRSAAATASSAPPPPPAADSAVVELPDSNVAPSASASTSAVAKHPHVAPPPPPPVSTQKKKRRVDDGF